MLSSLRRRPLEPPSSLTVTTAQSSAMSRLVRGLRFAGSRNVSLQALEQGREPGSAADGHHSQAWFAEDFSRGPSGCSDGADHGEATRFSSESSELGSTVGAGIGIKQFGEARIFRQMLEVGIVAGLETQRGIDADGLVQIAQRVFHVSGQAIQRRHAIGRRSRPLGTCFDSLSRCSRALT